ncbi:hypothetical protein MVEN_00675500 [Mycena venus]|uniref:Uncharacterized protein n=1 Tax=Mycena venus TaxID=2733690 RepID=A0A8H6YR11_9AGAR|nr:hypothetical protein MVEN_00675500 [Mycena venus]
MYPPRTPLTPSSPISMAGYFRWPELRHRPPPRPGPTMHLDDAAVARPPDAYTAVAASCDVKAASAPHQQRSAESVFPLRDTRSNSQIGQFTSCMSHSPGRMDAHTLLAQGGVDPSGASTAEAERRDETGGKEDIPAYVIPRGAVRTKCRSRSSQLLWLVFPVPCPSSCSVFSRARSRSRARSPASHALE